MTIENVSDTARWVAIYRAMETERPDAIFRDPFARQLGGARGEAIVDSLRRGRAAAWAMITRTAVFDEIIASKVKGAGVDLVRCAQMDPGCAEIFGVRAGQLARDLGRTPPAGAR